MTEHTSQEGVETEEKYQRSAGKPDSEIGEEETVESSPDRASWHELKESLEAVWDIAEKFNEDEATSARSAELLEDRLRKKHTELFDTLEGTLELADLTDQEVKSTFGDLISLARQHEKEYFVHQLTDPKVASGKARELHELFAHGLQVKADLQKEELSEVA